MPDGWVTTQEAAKVLRVDVSRVRQLCRAGLIAGAQKFGHGAWIIPMPIKRIRGRSGPTGRSATDERRHGD